MRELVVCNISLNAAYVRLYKIIIISTASEVLLKIVKN